MKPAWDWLVTRWQWPYATAFCGAILLLLAPAVWTVGGMAFFFIFLQLPLYMLHQLEEHAGDRFRAFTNEVIGGGVEVLSRPATFVINSLGVWGVDIVAITLAAFVSPGWGLMAIYLPLVNTVGHVAQAVLLRRYNPGLITAVLLFLPGAGAGLVIVTLETGAGWAMQATGLAVAIVVHAMIIVHVKRCLLAAKRSR